MRRQTILEMLQLLSATRANVDDAVSIVRGQTLQPGDRSIIEHALGTMLAELDVVSATLADMLLDPDRAEP